MWANGVLSCMLDHISALLKKYNHTVPRYTSYPPAYCLKPISGSIFEKKLLQKSLENKSGAYIHIPFCSSICSYCGCFTYGNCPQNMINEYIDSLCAEIVLSGKSHRFSLSEIHFGGGSPTHLQIDSLKKILKTISEYHMVEKNAQLSIEIDPRTVDQEKLSLLKQIHFSRVSLGIQDFDEDVQKAIGRLQSQELSIKTIQACKQLQFPSINIDLVYGLPRQTIVSFLKTIETTIFLQPDRISLFSFAYLPEIRPNQKQISEKELPSSLDKASMFLQAKKMLCSAGYKAIGLDHFVLPHDDLYHAFLEKKLHRNFQGYTTGIRNIVGYGVSALSTMERFFCQNTKQLSSYKEQIYHGLLPTALGYIQSDDDVKRDYVIKELMCYLCIDKQNFFILFAEPFDTYFFQEMALLSPFIEDGLIKNTQDSLSATEVGAFFIRNIASIFDTFTPSIHGSRTV